MGGTVAFHNKNSNRFMKHLGWEDGSGGFPSLHAVFCGTRRRVFGWGMGDYWIGLLFERWFVWSGDFCVGCGTVVAGS